MEEKEPLRDIVPPSEPPIPPLDASRVAAWFCDSYLPEYSVTVSILD